MELCTARVFSKIPSKGASLAAGPVSFGQNSSLFFNQNVASRTGLGVYSRLLRFAKSLPRAAMSEDGPSAPNQYVVEERNEVITFEDSAGTEKIVNAETVTSESREGEPVETEQSQSNEFFDNIKLDTIDAYSVVLYGSVALGGVWFASAIVRAIDSIPLFPKLMEIVGLAYTFWFTSRYLLFKQSRDELAAKVEDLKKQVLGSGEE